TWSRPPHPPAGAGRPAPLPGPEPMARAARRACASPVFPGAAVASPPPGEVLLYGRLDALEGVEHRLGVLLVDVAGGSGRHRSLLRGVPRGGPWARLPGPPLRARPLVGALLPGLFGPLHHLRAFLLLGTRVADGRSGLFGIGALARRGVRGLRALLLARV